MVETWEGTDRLTFQYDYMGRRVEKKVYDGQTLTTHLKFVYDGFKLVEELNGADNNAPLRRYAWQPFEAGLDVVLQMMDVPGNTYSFHLHDANKNVMQVSFDIGVAANTYQYSPFGQHLDAQLRFISFSSEYYDPTTDLYYYNYRYYNPFYNKWIDRDPIAEDGDINVYAMLMNNPIGMTDALGLICCNGIETGDDECCFNDEIMTMDLDIQANEGGKCCINLIKICLTTKKLVHQNIAIGDSVFSYGLDNNFYLFIFPQFWDSASVYIDVKGKEIECFNVKKSVATVLASEMYKMTNTNTCERGPYGLPNWGEHGGNCRAFSQAFYNEFKKQEYTGDLPQCEED